MSNWYTSTDHFVLLPAILLALFGCAVLLLDFFLFGDARQRKYLIGFLALGELFTGIALARQWQALVAREGQPLIAFQGALNIDGFAIFYNGIFVLAALLTALISYRYLDEENEHHGEYYGLLLLSQCGMFFLAAGTDLITAFIGLELMALSFYVLVGFLRTSRRSNEAAMKYFILGAISSGFLLYGFSILYGISGSTMLAEITEAVRARGGGDPFVILAMGMIAVGLLFKVAAAPFHMWAPDAYEGAPTPITAYLSTASKAASVAFLVRLFLAPLGPARPLWEPLLAIVAILSLTVGNFGALTQTNVKRLLAYSSISHAGYILFGLIAGNKTGIEGIAVYLLVYTFMTIGAFLVLIALRRRGLNGEELDDLAGLMKTNPGYAVLMLIFMLSLAGIPPTAGFIGKYYIFLALIETKHYVLAVIGGLYVLLALYYYFKVVKGMFMEDSQETAPLAESFGVRVALVLTGVLTLAIGLYPEPLMRWAQLSLPR